MRARVAHLLVVLALLAAPACRRGDAARAPGDEAAAAGDSAAAARAQWLAGDEGCMLDTTMRHADPEALVVEFLRRDAEGQFLQTDDWFNGATTCPGHEPGPDGYTVIRSYTSSIVRRTTDEITVAVTSDVMGWTGHGGFTARPSIHVDTVMAVRTPFGWRIDDRERSALRQLVLESTAAARGDLRPVADTTAGGVSGR